MILVGLWIGGFFVGLGVGMSLGGYLERERNKKT
jgi:hypothetical protein